MKFIVFKTFFLASFYFLLCSCTNENEQIDYYDQSIISKHESLNVAQNQDVSKLKEIARIMSKIALNKDAVNEVKEGVEKNIELGFDEAVRFIDILNPENSKILKSNKEGLVSQNLKKTLIQKKSLVDRSSNTLDISSFINTNDVQIYWPYSENWDGSSLPVISFDPMEDLEMNYAYRYALGDNNNMIIDSILVDEEYMKKHPVWIINKNEISYEELPDFSKGEYTKNGVLYHSEKYSKSLGDTKKQLRIASSQKVYEFVLSEMLATHQYDSRWSGGSEFRILCGFPVPVFVLRHHIISIHFSRNAIDKKIPKSLNEILNYDWTASQQHNIIKVWEDDPGKDVNFTITLNTSYKNETTGQTTTGDYKATFKMNNKDEHIFEETLPRTSMFINASRTKVISRNGVSLTCKINTHNIIP